MNDLRFAFRQLLKNPGFTAVVVISLALGISVNTLVFTWVNAVLLQPIPIQNPGRIANIFTSREGLQYGRSSYADYLDLRDRANVFSGVLARCYWPVSVGPAKGKPEVILGSLVSGNYFDVLGVSPLLGRTFSASEGIVMGADPVVVLSHRFWQRRLAANPDVVGQTVLLNARAFTVIGVAPDGFNGLMTGIPEDVWIPITMKAGIHPGDIPLENRGGGWLDIVASLKNGVSLPQAQAALNTVASQLAQEYPDDNRDKKFVLVGGQLSRFPVLELGRGVQALMAILTEVSQPHFYVPLAQAHVAFTSLLVKANGDPRTLIGPVLRELERLDPNLPITDVKTLAQQMELQYYPARIAAVSVGAFGLLALVLATLGVYGVMAYAVGQRTHELGVRTALGASRWQILSLVFRQGLLTTLIGAGLGFLGALGAARLLAKFLPGISPLEPVVFVAVASVLGAAALLACYLPARRAAEVDPMEALRTE